MTVEVRAHARLHLGFLDPSGRGARRFGGLGLAIDRPRFVLEAEAAPLLIVEGEQAPRVERLARRFLDAAGIRGGARLRVKEAIPPHVGLGSGTQTALAIGAALARLHDVAATLDDLCAFMGRARRSGVGRHLFDQGGFVVEGGHRTAEDRAAEGRAASDRSSRPGRGVPPLLLRRDVPEDWRIVLAVPDAAHTVSGDAEERAFETLPPAPPGAVESIARLVLLGLLPALAEDDLDAFGTALAEVQERVGGCFAAVQDGIFHPAGAGLVRRLKAHGACGVGQSSWGPAVYAFAPDDAGARRLADLIRAEAPGAAVFPTAGRNQGAALAAI